MIGLVICITHIGEEMLKTLLFLWDGGVREVDGSAAPHGTDFEYEERTRVKVQRVV